MGYRTSLLFPYRSAKSKATTYRDLKFRGKWELAFAEDLSSSRPICEQTLWT